MNNDPQLPEEEPIDPLSNYEPPVYDDPLEEALAECPVTAMCIRPFVVIRPETPVQRVLQAMAGLELSCVLIGENDRLVGMFTQRDVLNKVVDRYDQLRQTPIRELMTPDPVVVYDVDCVASALCAMTAGGYRHVPVVNMDNKIVGVVGPRRMTRFLQQQFDTP